MSTETIITAINKILEEDFEIDQDLLKPESMLREDLELDSLDAVDLVVAIEKTYGFRMNEEEARAMQTLNDISNENATTIVFPLPMEILNALGKPLPKAGRHEG